MKAKGFLLPKAAREAISSVFTKNVLDAKSFEINFPEKAGVFVELYKKDELRGSIGFPEPTYSIGRSLAMAAKAAAFEDPRFPPIKQEEMNKIKINVLILSVPEQIKARSKIKPGEGIMVRFGPNQGVLLPKETEGKRVEDILDAVCEKAGLAPETWHDTSARFYRFTAETYGED